MTTYRFLAALFLALQFITPSLADDAGEASSIVFIYDSSGSMWGQIDGTAKVEIAREVMASTVANLPEQQDIGLVAYGHRSEGECQDVETLLTHADRAEVSPALEAIRPLGKTPLAWSATQVIEQLRQDGQKATVILLTDGIESCGGDLCEVVKAAREGGVEFVMHIVGFGLKDGETAPLQCAAQAGGGQYFDADNAEELAAGLQEATTRTVDLAGNISVRASKNGEPLDTFIEAFPAGSKDRVETARSYHKGALFYLPAGAYDLKVVALEDTDLKPIWVRNIQVSEEELSEHEVSFDAGTVRINVLNNGEGWDSTVRLYDGEEEISHGRTYGRPKDLQVPPGVYRAQVQALAVKGLTTSFDIPGIEVRAGEVTEVEHPFESGVAMIGVSKGEELVDAMVSIDDLASGRTIVGGRTYTSSNSNPRRFELMPGDYTVEVTTLGVHKGHRETFDISVSAGGTVEKSVVVPLQEE